MPRLGSDCDSGAAVGTCDAVDDENDAESAGRACCDRRVRPVYQEYAAVAYRPQVGRRTSGSGRDRPVKVVVPVKRVPDTAGEKPLDPDDLTLDREKVESILCPMNEYAIEEACRLKEQHGAEVTVLLVGPEGAQSVVRKALSYGLDAAVQVSDEAIHGSDAIATAKVIAAALRHEEFDVVMMGAQATDARTSIVPAAVAELLGLPSLTYARQLNIDGERIVIHRETDEGWHVVESSLPAVVSVVESINDPRYPSFKGIMAAKSKPLAMKSLADVGLDPGEVGLGNEWARVVDAQPRPYKEAGKKVEDDGTGEVGAKALADWLVEQKII